MQVTMTGRKSILFDNFRLCQFGNLTISFSSLTRGCGVMFLENFTFHVKSLHTQSDNISQIILIGLKLYWKNFFYADFIL